MATRRTPFDETKPLVVGDWLSDKDILAWLDYDLESRLSSKRKESWNRMTEEILLKLSTRSTYALGLF